jgi:hypothetical protein
MCIHMIYIYTYIYIYIYIGPLNPSMTRVKCLEGFYLYENLMIEIFVITYDILNNICMYIYMYVYIYTYKCIYI